MTHFDPNWMKNPESMARFFCFMGYKPARVERLLRERLGIGEADAQRIVRGAENFVRASDQFVDSEIAKDEAAIAAEHNLNQINDPRGGS